MHARSLLVAVALCGCGSLYDVSAGPDAPRRDAPAVADTPTDMAPDGPPSGPIAYYPMEQLGAGSQCVTDASGNGHEGSCPDDPAKPAVIATGHSGNAFHFDASALGPNAGSGQAFLVTPDAQLSGSAMTVTVWLRPDPSQDTIGCPVNRADAATGSDAWQICVTQPNAIDVYTSDTAIDETVPESFGIGWHHFALTWTGSVATLYYDGASLGSQSSVLTYTADDVISIGRDIDTEMVAAPYTGDVDELRLYDRALSPAEIAQQAME